MTHEIDPRIQIIFNLLESRRLLDHARVQLDPPVVALDGPLDVQRVRPTRRRVLDVALEVAREPLGAEVLLPTDVR